MNFLYTIPLNALLFLFYTNIGSGITYYIVNLQYSAHRKRIRECNCEAEWWFMLTPAGLPPSTQPSVRSAKGLVGPSSWSAVVLIRSKFYTQIVVISVCKLLTHKWIQVCELGGGGYNNYVHIHYILLNTYIYIYIHY